MSQNIDIDRFSGEPPITKIDLYCELCGRAIYANERRYKDNSNNRICADCYNGQEEEYEEEEF